MFFIEFIFLLYEKKIVFFIFYYLGEKFGDNLDVWLERGYFMFFKFFYFLVFMGFYKLVLII